VPVALADPHEVGGQPAQVAGEEVAEDLLLAVVGDVGEVILDPGELGVEAGQRHFRAAGRAFALNRPSPKICDGRCAIRVLGIELG